MPRGIQASRELPTLVRDGVQAGRALSAVVPDEVRALLMVVADGR
ncbi:MAG TPA: hypothetical protein VMU95_09990 [Trebonia sp.]|nr:hypothetical protein [Trebonia sp.]